MRIASARVDQCSRLRIVDHDELLLKRHPLLVLLAVHQEKLAAFLREVVFGSVQCIVKGLGQFKEIVATGDDVPASGNLDFAQQGNKAIQHLSHTAANGG